MSNINIVPLGDRIIVKPIEREVTKSGIIIPDTAKDKTTEGEVVAVGQGKLGEKGERAPMDIKKGDKILFSSRYPGMEVKIDDVKYLIMHQEDVLGIIK